MESFCYLVIIDICIVFILCILCFILNVILLFFVIVVGVEEIWKKYFLLLFVFFIKL